MSPFTLGLLYGGVTLLVMFSGMPISFSLGLVATIFMFFFMPLSALDTVTQNVYEEMSAITLLSIPLFILKGAAIGRSPAGRDLYSALHVWMHRIPGGLGLATTELEARIDDISQKLTGFFIGRYDIRYANDEDLRAGKDFQIIELNGVASEATTW